MKIISISSNSIFRAMCVTFGIIFAFTPTSILHAQANNDQLKQIEDVSAKKNFISLRDSYTDGNSFLVCAEISQGRFALWNPVTNEVAQSSSEHDCKKPDSYRFMRALTSLEGDAVMTDTSFNGATKINLKFGRSTHCSPTLNSYYVVTPLAGESKAFYIAARLSKPETYQLGQYCEGDENIKKPVVQFYDLVRSLVSIDLKDGRTLLYSLDDRTKAPTILIIKSLPDKVWASSDGNIFLIPGNILFLGLKKAGQNFTKRYETLLEAIDQSNQTNQPNQP